MKDVPCPLNWKAKRLKHIAHVTAGQSPESVNVTYSPEGLPFLQGCAEFGPKFPISDKYCSIPPKIATAGSWLISVRAPVGRLNSAEQDYCIGRGLASVFATNTDQSFLGYVLASKKDFFDAISTGSTFQAISTWQLENLEIQLPPLKAQHRIAQFLDKKTAQIDGLIEKKRDLLDRLAEKRQALITRAVTKGLNPDVPMKPSGIDWLGDIPKHWEQCGIGQKIKLQRGVDITKSARVDGPIPVVSSGGIEYFHDVALCDGPGVLIGRKGSAGKLHFVSTPYWPHDTTLYVREFRGNHARFVWYVLHILDLASFDSGSSNPTVNRNNVHPARTVWPPLNEQISICEFLDQEMSRFDLQKDLVESSVDRLNEYRAALITAAVTGQLEVA